MLGVNYEIPTLGTWHTRVAQQAYDRQSNQDNHGPNNERGNDAHEYRVPVTYLAPCPSTRSSPITPKEERKGDNEKEQIWMIQPIGDLSTVKENKGEQPSR
jgi:hypothetical protein